MSRERNPRRVIVEHLRNVNRWMRWAVTVADHGARTYDAATHRLRPRTADEYLENDPALLREIAGGARDVAKAMTSLAAYMEAKAQALEEAPMRAQDGR